MTPPALALRNISKSYGPNRVLREISLEVGAGEACAVLGENGAGKSTLLKILAGVVRADGGTVCIDGRQADLGTPRAASSSGIAYIPQELTCVPGLTVAENICLGGWPVWMGFTSQAAAVRRAGEVARRFGFEIPLRRNMDRLSIAEQQLAEILKVLMRDARVILLDEPTAALADQDARRLLELTKSLVQQGIAIVYVSHRLDEVFRACDSIHVLRDGQLVYSGRSTETRPDQAIAHMLGRELAAAVPTQTDKPRSAAVLRLQNWHRGGIPAIREVSLEVGRGEVVGMYGLRGSGVEYIAEALGGLHGDVKGDTFVGGSRVRRLKAPADAKKAGIAYVPADRKADGLILGLSIQHQISLLNLDHVSRFGFVMGRRERDLARQYAARLHLRSQGLKQAQHELSGGNQQKVLLASRMAINPQVFVLHEPTRGVDVGARLEIHRCLRELANAGTGILLITSDIEEVTSVPERTLILRQGSIAGEIIGPRPDDQSRILQLAGGIG
jgi:ABC-type sugar transport system ATPase subunit